MTMFVRDVNESNGSNTHNPNLPAKLCFAQKEKREIITVSSNDRSKPKHGKGGGDTR